MSHISPLTYKVLAYQAVPNFNMDECVDWAIEMLSLGYNTEHLLILAGLSKPTNYFETGRYLEAATKELNLNIVDGDEGVIIYSSYYVAQVAKGVNVRANLKIICDYMLAIEHHRSIYDFYSLHWAWQDLAYDNQTWHWDGVTIDNIEQAAIDIAKQWMIDNERVLLSIWK